MLRTSRYVAVLGFFFFTWTLALVTAKDIDGGWSPWSRYGGNCSAECDNGTRNLHRLCQNPEPDGNGNKCLKQDGTRGLEETVKKLCIEKLCQTGYYVEECENCTVGVSLNWTMCGEEKCSYINPTRFACNKWDKTICPSPCEKAKCPEFGVCVDMSTKERPKYKCDCTMGYIYEEGSCIRPPPTLPTRRPIPTLPENQKKIATIVSKTASAVLVGFVGLCLILFLLLRVFTTLRVIQMNMEIAIVCAHILLLLPAKITEEELACKIVSMLIQFFFTACFNFMMLEAFYMYAMVAYVVKREGILTRLQNIITGWGLAVIVMIFCICFEYQNYGGEYQCWLQMDTVLIYGYLIPIIIVSIVTLTLSEAAGAADYIPLNGIDEEQLISARISQRTNLILLPFVIAHMIVGMLSEYEQNLPLYGTFSILNGITGGLIFFLHCSTSEKLRSKFKCCFKCCSKKTDKKK